MMKIFKINSGPRKKYGELENEYLLALSEAISNSAPPPSIAEIDFSNLTDQQIVQLQDFMTALESYADSYGKAGLVGEVADSINLLIDVLGRVGAGETGGGTLVIAEVVTSIIDGIADAVSAGMDDWLDYVDSVISEIDFEKSMRDAFPVDDLNFDNDPENDISNPNDDSGSAGDEAVANDAPDGSGDFPHPDISPLIIDLDGDGIELIALSDSTVQFDLDLDGFAERTGWVASDDAFLAYDINGNGIIDDQSELFGNSDAFANGFLSLAALDSNNDGVIDQFDAAYANLVLWQDIDSDGNTDAGELTSLADAGLTSIDLVAVSVSETNSGHTVSERSTVTWGDGHTSVIEDIWFEVDQRISDYILPDDFTYSTEALALPVLFGYGHIPSTWVALSQDVSLISESTSLVQQVNSGDIAGFVGSFEQFMLDWAGVADVDPASRGSYIDARHLAFLEEFYGSDFLQPGHGSNPGSADPNASASLSLEAQFDELVQKLAARFMVQASNSGTILSVLNTGAIPMVIPPFLMGSACRITRLVSAS